MNMGGYGSYFLDQSGGGCFIRNHVTGRRYLAGAEKDAAQRLVERLNKAHRPGD